jgi:hypothetical protein
MRFTGVFGRLMNVRVLSVRGQEDSDMDTIQRLADSTEREDVERYVRNRSFLAEVSDAIRRADAVRRLELSLQRRAALLRSGRLAYLVHVCGRWAGAAATAATSRPDRTLGETPRPSPHRLQSQNPT